ncbi:TcaA NTF2-like domain-containing protein [Desnuesiella massiliensis]|uniref:TcaA NTF2-like domain-containing protein n=1 Tax=Desnuesiella massiliensis TaxID=1650662 RepID=UPI0006E18A2F|nr:hypothetical protein [Desnuesiella massiliensis]
MKKKNIVYLIVFIILFLSSFLILNNLNNKRGNSNAALEQEKKEVKDKEKVESNKDNLEENKSQEIQSKKDTSFVEGTNEKSDKTYVEEIINNFNFIYSQLVKDKEVPLSYLNSVVIKDSEFYKYITEDIKRLREKNASINLELLEIKSITDLENHNEVKVVAKEKYKLNEEKEELKEYTSTYYIRLKSDSMGIYKKDMK